MFIAAFYKMRPLCPALQEKAERELNEKPARIPSDIKSLREWLEKQPHLQSVKPSDQLLVNFLRGSKYSLERTKQKIDMFYTLRTVVPEVFRERNPFDPVIQEILEAGCFLPLKVLSEDDACRVCIMRFEKAEPSKHKLIDIIKVAFMIIEILVFEDDNFVISGEKSIIDLKGVGISTLAQFTPALAKKMALSVEKAAPIRMKATYYINLPPGFDTVLSIFKSVIPEKLSNRLHTYPQNFDALYDILPRDILPKEYGGDKGTVKDLIDHWKSKVESYSEIFMREEEQRSDESLRPEKPMTTTSLFGIEGSFRKLEVD